MWGLVCVWVLFLGLGQCWFDFVKLISLDLGDWWNVHSISQNEWMILIWQKSSFDRFEFSSIPLPLHLIPLLYAFISFGLGYLKVLMLVDWKINMSMDEIRPHLLHILFVCGMFHEHSPLYYISNTHWHQNSIARPQIVVTST